MTDPIKMTIRERTIQIGTRTSPAGFEIVDGDAVFAWSWSRERCQLILAAIRLAEADCALIDHEDAKPTYPKPGEIQAWSDERDVLIGRHSDAEDAYRAAKEGA